MSQKKPDQLLSARIASLGADLPEEKRRELLELVLQVRVLERAVDVVAIKDALAMTAGWLSILVKQQPEFQVFNKSAKDLLGNVQAALRAM